MLLSIDSGANLGWAIFDEKSLIDCGLARTPAQLQKAVDGLIDPISRIIIERPHAGRTRARARDILTLAVRAGEAGGLLRYLTGVEPEYWEPGKWKGQIPKKRCNTIVEAKLSPTEKLVLGKITPPSARHNVLDAIGIGLHAVGRGII